MKLGLLIQGAFAGLLLVVALLCVGSAQRFYPTTIPFALQSAACVALAATGLRLPERRRSIFWVLTTCHGLLFFPFLFAMALWPADDGTGMIWLAIVAGGSCLAGVISVVFLVVGWVSLQHAGAEPGAPPNGGPAMRLGNSGATGGPPSVS
jgi:hypothetical protein